MTTTLSKIFVQEFLPIKQATHIPADTTKPDAAEVIDRYFRKGYKLAQPAMLVTGDTGGAVGVLLLFKFAGEVAKTDEAASSAPAPAPVRVLDNGEVIGGADAGQAQAQATAGA